MIYLSHNFNKIFSFFFICALFLFPGCGGKRAKSDHSSKTRQEQRKQKRILERHQAEFGAVKRRYAYEERLIAGLNKKELFETEKDEKFAQEIKKIVLIKSHNMPWAIQQDGAFMQYKNALEGDINVLNDKIAQLGQVEWLNKEPVSALHTELQTFLSHLDSIFDVIYLDLQVVREVQMASLTERIKKLENDKDELSKQLNVKKEAPVTVVINNGPQDLEDLD